MKQPARLGHHQQRADREGARGLAEDGHVAGVAAECLDVVANPAQRRDLIELAEVRAGSEPVATVLGEREIAERTESIIDGHDHRVAALRERATVVHRRAARAEREGSAVDPEQHRPAPSVRGGCIDVQVEAVLAERTAGGHTGDCARPLHRR
jgi:hypothetical protein